MAQGGGHVASDRHLAAPMITMGESGLTVVQHEDRINRLRDTQPFRSLIGVSPTHRAGNSLMVLRQGSCSSNVKRILICRPSSRVL